jgi:hypothetical protein
MFGLITLAGGAIIIGISFIVDADGTLKLVVNAITIRGVTWIIKKVIGSMDRDKADLINMTGWSIAGVSIIGILKNAIKGVKPIIQDIGETMETLRGIKDSVEGFAEWIDKLTFWN